MEAKTLTLNVAALLLATGFSGLIGVLKAGDLKRGMFEAQAVVGISGEIFAAEPHTSSAQVRGGLSPFFKKKLMIAGRQVFSNSFFISQRPPQALTNS